MHFFAFDNRVFVFVEYSDRSKRAIMLNDVYVGHVRRVAKSYPLLCKAIVHLVLDLIYDDDGIG